MDKQERAAKLNRRLPGALGREVAPWGLVAQFGTLGGGEALVEDTDPFARLDGKTGAEFYRGAEANCPPLSWGRLAVQNRMLSEGWVIEAGSAGTRDAADLRDWTRAWMGRRELRLTETLPLLCSYIFYGWSPFQQLWGDWTWSRTVTSRRSGRRFKVPSSVIEKDTRMFRFNVDRNLVFTHFGAAREIFPIAERSIRGRNARMSWLTPRRGSEDIPYGRGLYRTSGSAAAYLLWRDLWKQWQRGIDRSQGLLIIKRAEAISGALNDDEVTKELEKVVAMANSTGVISPPPGYDISWLENTVAYKEGWKDPLDRVQAYIALSLTGQGLSISLGTGGAQGSRAAGEVEEGRAARWGRGYAIGLAETVTACMIDPALVWNWGDVPEDLRPRFVFRSTRSVNLAATIAYVDLFQDQPGADPPDPDVFADQLGVPTLRNGEWSARPLPVPDPEPVEPEPVEPEPEVDDVREDPDEEDEAVA